MIHGKCFPLITAVCVCVGAMENSLMGRLIFDVGSGGSVYGLSGS